MKDQTTLPLATREFEPATAQEPDEEQDMVCAGRGYCDEEPVPIEFSPEHQPQPTTLE